MHKNNHLFNVKVSDDVQYGDGGYNNNATALVTQINNSTTLSKAPTSTAFYSRNVTRPVRLPQSYFDAKRIVDVY